MNILNVFQSQSGLLILSGIAVVAIILWVFWPQKGLFSMLSKIKKNQKRVLLEDALKYLFDCEYNKVQCSMNSISGHLNISDDKAGQLIEHLHSMNLINYDKQHLELTDTGRSYALKIVRIHRIWERYLADETSTAQTDWHVEADRLEHIVSAEDTEKIAAQIGHPVFDPHGDPIPSPDGKLPEFKGRALHQLKKGDSARIVHIEDEPKSIYEQLVVQGLYPGMDIYVTDVQSDKISFAANGNEFALTPLFAAQISLELQEAKEKTLSEFQLLSNLKIGEKAEVAEISSNCRGQQRRRLMDLGIVPGSEITAIMRSASNDPTGYRVMGTTIGIRKKQAEMIFIHKKKEKQNE